MMIRIDALNCATNTGLIKFEGGSVLLIILGLSLLQYLARKCMYANWMHHQDWQLRWVHCCIVFLITGIFTVCTFPLYLYEKKLKLHPPTHKGKT